MSPPEFITFPGVEMTTPICELVSHAKRNLVEWGSA